MNEPFVHFHDPGRVLLETEVLEDHVTLFRLDDTVGPDQHGPLEAGRVAAVDHRFPHDLDLVDDARVQQQAGLQNDLERLLVDGVGWFLVEFDQADPVEVTLVVEGPPPVCLMQSRRVVLAQFGGHGMQPPLGRLVGMVLEDPRFTLAEEFPGADLLVYLDPAAKADLVPVEWFRGGVIHVRSVFPAALSPGSPVIVSLPIGPIAGVSASSGGNGTAPGSIPSSEVFHSVAVCRSSLGSW